MDEKRVQVHFPYWLLLARFDDILNEGINPEVYLDGEALDSAGPEDLKRIREEFGKRDLRITVHGPYLELNPGSADEDTRRRTVERYRQIFKAASCLRPGNIVLHAGYNDRKFKGDHELWLSQSLKTWPEFVKEAERLGLRIAAEHIFEKTPATLKALIEKIGSPNFGVCIDSGHLNVFAKADMEEWLRELGPYVAEVHLHDNNGKNDDHLPLGEGSIDFNRLFGLVKTYSKDPVFTIEPHGEDAIKRAIKAVKRFI